MTITRVQSAIFTDWSRLICYDTVCFHKFITNRRKIVWNGVYSPWKIKIKNYGIFINIAVLIGFSGVRVLNMLIFRVIFLGKYSKGYIFVLRAKRKY